LTKLNYQISWAYLNNKMYREALETFEYSAFDPIELLEKVFPYYLQVNYANNQNKQAFYKKDPHDFLINLFKSKRRNILKDYPNPDQENVNRLHTSGGEVKASVWLDYIDYALIKCMIEMKIFD
jgi:hypothetical protein